VTTAARLPDAPEIPTIAEAGVPGFDAASWIMIVAPANTPKGIVARLHAEIKQIFRLPEVEEQLVKAGMVPIDSPPPADLQRFIEAEILRWGKVAQQAGIAGSE
jgi:tripartite-type tricarboxylate transporter receptor subunit TctC